MNTYKPGKIYRLTTKAVTWRTDTYYLVFTGNEREEKVPPDKSETWLEYYQLNDPHRMLEIDTGYMEKVFDIEVVS